MRTIDKSLAAFSGPTLQAFRRVAMTLRNDGHTMDDAIAYILGMPVRPPDNNPAMLVNKCPECGMAMNVYTVNTSAEDQVDPEYHSMWMCGTSCSGKGCGYEEYSPLSIQDQIEKLLRENANGTV